jgi:hypothetical protein
MRLCFSPRGSTLSVPATVTSLIRDRAWSHHVDEYVTYRSTLWMSVALSGGPRQIYLCDWPLRERLRNDEITSLVSFLLHVMYMM